MTVLSRLIRFFTTGILEVRLKELDPVRAFFVKYLRVIVLTFLGFARDNCTLRASSLTYYSLLSIVPVIAMAFGIAKGFGLQKLMQKHVVELAQNANWPDTVTDSILSFAESLLKNTHGGVIAGVGFLTLFWAVISILEQIEGALNTIWEVNKPRTFVRRITDYSAIVILTPILLVVSGSAAVLVTGKAAAMIQQINLLGVLGPLIFVVLKLVPYLSIWTMLFMCYLIIPNVRVQPKSALLAAVVTGTVFQVVQFIYIKFQIGVAGYGAIYGGFAALPLFIAWLNLSWMIVLFGAEIAFAHENHETFGFHPDFSRLSISSTKLLFLRVFHLMVKRFSGGEPAVSPSEIANALEIPLRLVRRILAQLSSAGLVVETTVKVRKEPTFQPGRATDDVRIQLVLDAYERLGTGPVSAPPETEAERVAASFHDISEALKKAPENVLLKDI